MAALFRGRPLAASSAVATAPSPATSGTTLVVTSGHGARFPVALMPYKGLLWDGADPTTAEIVDVTGRSTDTLTMVRAQDGTSARTVVVGDKIVIGDLPSVWAEIQNAIWPPITELISFGHSLTTGYGGTSAEWSWPARLSKATDCELEVYGQNGAILTIDDVTASIDGGWPTVFKRLKPPRTAAPYLSGWGAVSLHYGLNDLNQLGTANSVRDAYKACDRACIGVARSSRWFPPNVSPVTKSGASHASLTGSEDSVINGRLDYITTADGSYWELAVPSDYPGNSAIWIFTLAQTTNGFLGGVLVDGSGSGFTINGAAVNTIDTRALATVVGVNNVHGWRIPIAASGAHTVRVTPTTITGGVASIQGFSIEAEVPPVVIKPLQYKLPSYAPFSGAPFPATDATIDSLNSWITGVAAELTDGRVFTADLDTPINKLSRYLYSDGVHLNDAGAELAGATVFDAWRAAGLLDGRTVMATAKKGSILIARQPVKRPCRVASVANVNLASAPTTLDGVTLNFFDRCLIKNQTAPAENWIYRWLGPTRPMERADDADSAEEVFGGVEVFVQEGTTQNKQTKWAIANTGAIVIGTTPIRVTRTSPDVMLQPQRSFWTPGSNSIEVFPGAQCSTNLSALTTQRMLLLGGIVIPAGVTISTIAFLSGTTAAGTPTNQLFGLYRQSNLARLAVTTDGTTGAWAANTVKALNLASAYTPDEDMPVYVAIMVKATTVPTLQGTIPLVQSNTIAPVRMGQTADTGLTTTLPSTAGAITALANLPYAYIY